MSFHWFVQLASVETPLEISGTHESLAADEESAEPLWFKEIRSEEDEISGK